MTSEEMSNSRSFKLSPAMVLVVGVLGFFALFIVCGLCTVFYSISVKNAGKTKEIAISTQYKNDQNELAAYVGKFTSSASVVQGQTDALNKILVEAIQGRYQGNTSAQPGQGSLFSAIQEAYPETSLVELQKNWSRLLDIIDVGTETFKNQQSKLLSMLNDYETWRNNGMMRQVVLNMGFVNFPSSHLVADFGNQHLTGQAAYDKMYNLVLNGGTTKAFEEDSLDPLTLPTRTTK